MTTFRQFLLEEEDDDDEDRILTLVELIKKDCKQFWKERSKGRLLLRGLRQPRPDGKVMIGSFTVPYYEKTVRNDRTPLSMPNRVHNMLDDWFYRKFHMFARSSTMFCYGEEAFSAARQYGKVHAVFPIGNFSYVWSKEVHDLFNLLDSRQIIDNPHEEDVADLLNSLGYKSSDLKSAMKSSAEIMVKCYSYYAIPAETENQRKLIKAALE
jgi:hypothetical protein